MPKVPVVEQKELDKVTISLKDVVAAPKSRVAQADAAGTPSVGLALADIQAEHKQRAAYISHIQQYVSGERTDAPGRVEPNVSV